MLAGLFGGEYRADFLCLEPGVFVLAGTFIALALWHKYILPRPASDAQRTNITPHTILVEFGNTFVSFFQQERDCPALLLC